MSREEVDPEEDRRRFDAHRVRFFALIGHCVTQYQSVEEFLPKVFAAALGGSEAKALAIFALARGLEAKLDAITAALTDAAAEHKNSWASLMKRVAKAAAARNQIAHASPVHHGGSMTIILDREPTRVHRVVQTGWSKMELRKRTRAGEAVWTAELMEREWERAGVLFSNLIAFSKDLRGEIVPDHLRRSDNQG